MTASNPEQAINFLTSILEIPLPEDKDVLDKDGDTIPESPPLEAITERFTKLSNALRYKKMPPEAFETAGGGWDASEFQQLQKALQTLEKSSSLHEYQQLSYAVEIINKELGNTWTGVLKDIAKDIVRSLLSRMTEHT